MAELSAGWAQTVTAVNLAHIATLTNLDPVCDALCQLKSALPVKEVPVNEQWRLGLLDSLLALRSENVAEGEDIKRVVSLLSSLCST